VYVVLCLEVGQQLIKRLLMISVVGTPSNLWLILEHIIILNGVRILSIYLHVSGDIWFSGKVKFRRSRRLIK